MKRLLILMVICCLSGCSETRRDMKVIGHRGAMGHETENTLASVQKALDMGVDMIEIDVFVVKSGEVVVFHDERLERLSHAEGRIEDWNYMDLKKVKLEGGHSIPVLQEVLDLIDKKVRLNIELKGPNTSNRVHLIMENYIEERGWSLEDFLISSFNWEELRSMRAINPQVAIAVLTEEDPVEAIPVANELGAVAINPNFKSVSAENVDTLHEAGFEVYTWTVNKKEDIERMRKYGVDGVFTNYPERAR